MKLWDEKRMHGNRRDQILDVAMQIAEESGARHLTIDAVVRKTGLSKGGVLYHFPSKVALLEGLVARVLKESRARIERYRQKHADSPCPTLAAMCSVTGELLDGRFSLPVALHAAAAENPALLRPVAAFFAELHKHMRREYADEDAAFVLWCALEGIRQMATFSVAPGGRARLIRALARVEEMIARLPRGVQA